MSDCELCDYYQRQEGPEAAAKCLFTGALLREEPDFQYPCRNMSFEEYEEYLHKRSRAG